MKDRIRKILDENHITQAEFARRIGIQPSTINMWLKGTREPTEALKRNICREFNVCREWLEFGTGEMHPEAPGWDEMVSRVMRGENDFARQTMAAFCALSDEQWQQLRDILDTLKKAGL